MNNYKLISIDLAKNVFQVCVLNEHNKPVFNKKVTRNKLVHTVMKFSAPRIVMEACYSSNYWGREFQSLGYSVDLIPPHQVKPFVVGNKNDHNDALAIAEASLRPKVSCIKVKSLSQQDIQSLFRIRERLLRSRTATANQLRGLLAEYGVILEKTLATLRKKLPSILEDKDNHLTEVSRQFFQGLYKELITFDEKIAEIDTQTQALLNTNDDYLRLQTIPGIGPIISGHLIAGIEDAKQFKNGRNMAAWVGLTPKQYSSGEKSRMGGISKRGNQTLRKLFIHGARTVIRWCENKTDPLSLWLKNLLRTKHTNKVVTALANKMVRMAWAILRYKTDYNANQLTAVSV